MPFASVNNQRIYYEDSDGGPAVVFLHGFLMDQSMFDPQVAALAPRFRCVRFDARAFGRTEWDGKPFTLYDTVADCVGLMDHLGIDRAAIVGMSQGGFATLRLALQHPERVKALFLIGTRSAADEEEFKKEFRQMGDTWRKEGPTAELLEGLMTFIIGPREQTANLWAEWIPKWKAQTGERMLHAVNNVMDRDDLTLEQLRRIVVPTMVAHGDADQGVPIALGEALAAALPNCEGLIRVAGAAHAANLSHPQQINPHLVKFMNKHA